MASIRITKTMAADIASRVLASIPKKHSVDLAQTKVREYVQSTLPSAVQVLIKHPEISQYLRSGYVNVGQVSMYVTGYAGHSLGAVPESLMAEIKEIYALVNQEKTKRTDLEQDLITNLMACKNLTKAYDVLPELTKYLDYFNVTQPTYQIITTKLANDLKALGYKP